MPRGRHSPSKMWVLEEEDAERIERVMKRLYSERLRPGEMRDLAQTLDRVMDGLFELPEDVG